MDDMDADMDADVERETYYDDPTEGETIASHHCMHQIKQSPRRDKVPMFECAVQPAAASLGRPLGVCEVVLGDGHTSASVDTSAETIRYAPTLSPTASSRSSLFLIF